MAAPSIVSVTAVPTTLAPGQTAVIDVVAADGDNRSLHISFTVTDASGGTGTGSVTIPINDPLTITGTTDGGTLVKTGPARFTITA